MEKYYLLPNWDNKIIPFCFFLFIIIFFSITFFVLQSPPADIDESDSNSSDLLGTIWAAILISLLSLTGIKWEGSSSWTESVGIVSPDYLSGRKAAERLGNTLEVIRRNASLEDKVVDDFLSDAKTLYKNIDDNLELESKNTREFMEEIKKELNVLIEQVKKFKEDETYGKSNFITCCKSKTCYQSTEFSEALTNLSQCWPKFGYKIEKLG
jgi:hypothetical protein